MGPRIVVICFVLLGYSGCRTNTPCPTCPSQPVSNLTIDTIVVESVEADLHLSTKDSTRLGSISLMRNAKQIFSGTINQKDTIFIDDSVVSSNIYTYRAYRHLSSGGSTTDSSNRLTFRTMDTTIHNFTWEIDTLGEGLNGYLKDVVVVNDSCAYAVGLIRIKDSSGNWDPNQYTVGTWDGHRWEYSVGAGAGMGAVFAFSRYDVWAGTSGLYHYTGGNWIPANISAGIGGYITKIWGTSGEDLFVVGTNDQIEHFDGLAWKHSNAGLGVDFTDVWGTQDGTEVWTCGWNQTAYGTYILKYTVASGWTIVRNGTQAQNLVLPDSISGTYTGVYTDRPNCIFIGSSAGLFRAFANTTGAARRLSFTNSFFPGFPEALRGNSINDITIVGDYAMIAHYNGATWRYFSSFRSGNQRLLAVSQRKNIVMVAGIIDDPINSKGVVYIGRR